MYIRFALLIVILAAAMVPFTRAAAWDDAYITANAVGPDSVLIEWKKGLPLSAYRLDVKRVVLSSGVEEDAASMYMPQGEKLATYVDTEAVKGKAYRYKAYSYDNNEVQLNIMESQDVIPLDPAEYTSSSCVRSGSWITGTFSWLPVEYANRYISFFRCGVLDIGGNDKQLSTVQSYLFPLAWLYDDAAEDTVCKCAVIGVADLGPQNSALGPETMYSIGTVGDLRALPDNSAGLQEPVLNASPSGDYSIRLSWTACEGADRYTVYKASTGIAELTGQTTYDHIEPYKHEGAARFTVAAWYDGIPAVSNQAIAMSAPLPGFSIRY